MEEMSGVWNLKCRGFLLYIKRIGFKVIYVNFKKNKIIL